MRTKKFTLDRHKLKYELTKKDPKKNVPKSVQLSRLDKPTKEEIKKIKRPGIIKTYIKCMIETILA